MIQNFDIAVDTTTLGEPNLAQTRADENAMYDFARELSESLAPMLAFSSITSELSEARHPDHPTRIYHIKCAANGERTVVVFDRSNPAHVIEIYRGYTPAAAMAWCRLDALSRASQNLMPLPDVNDTLTIMETLASWQTYSMIKDAPNRWMLSSPNGNPLGIWQSPHQGALVASLHALFGKGFIA